MYTQKTQKTKFWFFQAPPPQKKKKKKKKGTKVFEKILYQIEREVSEKEGRDAKEEKQGRKKKN